MAVILFCLTAAFAQTPKPGKDDKPLNPPPYANQPATGVAPPPEGTTPHDTPDLDKAKNQVPNAKGKKKPARKKKTQS
ncbi:MAG: hypothetical protein ABJF23_01005 [Bryobacteraceae bacterium]